MTFPEIKPVTAFENHQIEEVKPGLVRVSTQVTDKALNIYGTGHGGYLFTLADEIAGWTAISMGAKVVTLQASINYLRPALSQDKLIIEGQLEHKGKTTNLVKVTITNSKNERLAQATFTMYVTGDIIEDDKKD